MRFSFFTEPDSGFGSSWQTERLGGAFEPVMLSAQHARTSLAIGAAGAAVLAALCLVPGPDTCAPAPTVAQPGLPASDEGLTLTARLQSTSMPSGAHDEDIALAITAPARTAQARPPLTLAVVIDRSGSMEGQPMANAKAAALRLVDALAPSDTFSILTFSTKAEMVSRMAPATEEAKARARAAITQIYDDGGTCTSCGLELAVDQLGAAQHQDGGVDRIVLISDGHANEGLWDKDQLVQLASRIASGGASISTVGVGLDFDEVTMTRIAEVGRGNYYFVENTANLGAMFARELGGLADTVASDVHVTLRDVPGATAVETFGYPASRDGGGLVIPVADVRAGETRKVIVRIRVAAGASAIGATRMVATPELTWRSVGPGAGALGLRHAYARLVAEITDDAAAIAAGVDHTAVQEVEAARSARALDEATLVYETQGYAAAERVLQVRAQAIQARAAAIGDSMAMTKLDAESGEAMTMMKTLPPAKATKAVRVKSYELAR